MTEIAVVKPYYAEEQAYQMGYDDFEDAEPNDVSWALGHWKETARWCNIRAPELRAMAGFEDAGKGTYQQDREIAAVQAGCEEDHPAEAELVDASAIYSELVDAYDRGAIDAIEGRERGESL